MSKEELGIREDTIQNVNSEEQSGEYGLPDVTSYINMGELPDEPKGLTDDSRNDGSIGLAYDTEGKPAADVVEDLAEEPRGLNSDGVSEPSGDQEPDSLQDGSLGLGADVHDGKSPEDEYLGLSDGDELALPEDDENQDPGGTGAYEADSMSDDTGGSSNSGGEGSPDESGDDAGDNDAAADEASADIDAENEAIRQKIIERKREKKRKARRRRVRRWTFISLFFLTIAVFVFSRSDFFTVDSIEVEGNSHFTAEEIINIGHAAPGHNIIYDPGDKEIVDYLLQNPYIKSATVTRKFPSTLLITVVERKQACAFKYDDDYLIMDDEGILLKKTRTEPKLTMVKGLVISKLKLGETVGTQNQTMFSRLLKLIRTVNSSDLYFVKIDMSGYEEDGSVKAYIYDKLVVRSGYDALVDNLRNGRLHKVVEKLFEDEVKRGTITISDDGTISFEPGF